MPRAGSDADAPRGAPVTLSLILWKWHSAHYRAKFTGDHVNAVARMARRNYRGELRVICVTDDATGIDPDVEVLPDWRDWAAIPSPHGKGAPACYRRLRGFHPDIAQHFGPRFVSLDLDVVIVGDMTPVWDRDDDFVGLRDAYHPRQLNGSMWLLRSGSRPDVWTDFAAAKARRAAALAGYRGSDQAWMTYKLLAEPTWEKGAGIYSYRRNILADGNRLPPDARMVTFHGQTKPWDANAQAIEWVREHWGLSVIDHLDRELGDAVPVVAQVEPRK